ALPKQRRTDNQGPENGARLVERTVQAEAPAKPGLAARMRQHRVTRGGADRLARPLKHDQQSRKLPAARQRKERHGHKIDSVADKGDCPIAARVVGEIARNEAQSIAKEFAKSRDKTDHSAARSKDPKIRARGATRAFIGHVRKQTDNAKQHDEP